MINWQSNETAANHSRCAMKLHVSMNVEDFDASIKFYSTLFKQQPTVIRDDYAKWDVESPAVNFVIEPCKRKSAGLDHLGIQVDESDELIDLSERITASGQPATQIENANCCYANSDKAWVQGMAGEKWEAFLTHSHDSDSYGEDIAADLEAKNDAEADDACCAPTCCA